MYQIFRGILFVMIIPHIAKYLFKTWMESTFTMEYFDNSIDKIEWYIIIVLSIQIIIINSLLFLMTIRFMRQINGAPTFNDFWNFDFSKYWYVRSIFIGIALGCSYYFGMLALTGTPYGALIWNAPQPLQFYVILIFTFFSMILPPITEELFFRGVCYSIFRINLGLKIVPSILISSFLFTIWHPQIYHDHIVSIPIFFIGVIMCLLLEKIQSVVPLIITHSICNLVIWFLTHIL